MRRAVATGATRWQERTSAAAFEAFGWRVLEIDGHDCRGDRGSLRRRPGSAAGRQPTAILARTVKGQGLSFTEGRHKWHAKVPTADDVARARTELGLAEEATS